MTAPFAKKENTRMINNILSVASVEKKKKNGTKSVFMKLNPLSFPHYKVFLVAFW
jgi:hypothetical protein